MSDNIVYDGIDNLNEKFNKIIDTFNKDTELLQKEYEEKNMELIDGYIEERRNINLSYKKDIDDINSKFMDKNLNLKQKLDLYEKLKPLTEEKFDRDIKSLNEINKLEIDKFTNDLNLEEINKVNELENENKDKVNKLESEKTDKFDVQIEEINKKINDETNKLKTAFENKVKSLEETNEKDLSLLESKLKDKIDSNNIIYSDKISKIELEFNENMGKIIKIEEKNKIEEDKIKKEMNEKIKSLHEAVEGSNNSEYTLKLKKIEEEISKNDLDHKKNLDKISKKIALNQNDIVMKTKKLALLEKKIKETESNLSKDKKSLESIIKGKDFKDFNNGVNKINEEYEKDLKEKTKLKLSDYLVEQNNIFNDKFNKEKAEMEKKLEDVKGEFKSFQDQLKTKISQIKIIIYELEKENNKNKVLLKDYQKEYELIKDKSDTDIKKFFEFEKRIITENISETKERFIESYQNKFEEEKKNFLFEDKKLEYKNLEEKIKAAQITIDSNVNQLEKIKVEEKTILNDQKKFEKEIVDNQIKVNNLKEEIDTLNLNKEKQRL
jgi:hypothetical protein